LKEVKALHL